MSKKIMVGGIGDINNPPNNHEVCLDCLTLKALLAEKDAELQRAKALIDKLKLEAKCHAQEARTQARIVKECYQAVTGGTGEPGDWHGAEPVQKALAEKDAEIVRLQDERIELVFKNQAQYEKLREHEAFVAAFDEYDQREGQYNSSGLYLIAHMARQALGEGK